MAKKGGQVQLQVEINNEEDWEKFLEREGLLIVDVYSEWCGPCSAMSPNLKKIKLEIGGDDLHLAMAKCDNIPSLHRFKDKSEPTWLFIVGGKMVNLLFGCNSPKLMQMIRQELKKERAAREGAVERVQQEISEMAPEEQERFDVVESIRLQKEAVETEARIKALNDRRILVAETVLEAFPLAGLVLVFPNALKASMPVLSDIWTSADFKVSTSDKLILEEKDLDELLYFADYQFSAELIQTLSSAKCMVHLIKYKGDDTTVDFDKIILQLIYGESGCPPGSAGSPAEQLRCTIKIDEEENEEEEVDKSTAEEEVVIDGIWVPPNPFARATALKMLFPATTSAHVPPEPEPIPPFIAVSYDALKRKEVFALADEYPEDVMKYGFFTSENADVAKLIAKGVEEFEKQSETTVYGEKLILQLSKKHSDAVLAFAQLGPTYMSINEEEGARECNIFFPKDYDVEPEEIVEDSTPEIKVKKSKKRKPKDAQVSEEPGEIMSMASVPSTITGSVYEDLGEKTDEDTDTENTGGTEIKVGEDQEGEKISTAEGTEVLSKVSSKFDQSSTAQVICEKKSAGEASVPPN